MLSKRAELNTLVQEIGSPRLETLNPDSSATASEPLRIGARRGILPDAQLKRRRKGRKSMSRRNGQNGTIVIAGNWYRVRWRMDVEGQERRVCMSEKVAPVVFDKNGMPKPPSSEVQRKARELVEKSGANSEEHFNLVVLGEVTFRNQTKAFLHWVQNRDRERIKDTSSIEAALNKWILPELARSIFLQMSQDFCDPLSTEGTVCCSGPETALRTCTIALNNDG
jgi:hypothetical protein